MTKRINAWRECYRRSPSLASAAVFAAVGGLFALPLMWIDERTLLGESVWLKPMKFALSFSAYFVAFAWLLGDLPHSTRTKSFLQRGNLVGLLLESPPLLIQAARGFDHISISRL